ncbi:hypothetical protein [Neomoorella thermoacetica]|uniref:Uncharacterized protein n=1 Tax=Neomoorella thermoacetica TaxID=1525 RepID=A0A1J5JL09_NEOTH|nr:hypothetical protein [Moorella thermoacetica]APC09042.1 hypothetical protein MTJW_18900 [Moorella thermoacetica]OIQ09444.1 hypothetical protein MOOR_08220 [Moorella thermoacetica]OIQ12432.1 hypothetical protein MOOTH_07630 [Moorella thermoacetica]
MSKYNRLLSSILFIMIIFFISNTAFASFNYGNDEATFYVNNEGYIYPVKITNYTYEEWKQYDRFDNIVYYHVNDGLIKNGKNMPFDIVTYPLPTTQLFTNGSNTDTIMGNEWVPKDVLYPSYDIYYGGEITKNIYLPIGYNAACRSDYGFEALSDIGSLGTFSTYQSFSLW